MAVKNDYTYENIENPYDALLQRGEQPFPNIDLGTAAVNAPYNVSENALDGKTFSDLTLSNTMQSRNYNPKKQGFLIDGRMGYIECMQLYVGTGGIIGGSLDIPDTTSTESFHVDALGNSWWGANTSNPNLAPAIVLNTGDAKFNNVEITGTSTVGGRLASTIGGAIDVAGDFINDVINPRLDTQAAEILGDFTFGSSGSIAMAVDASNGIWLSPTGILGVKAGLPTFTITTSGDATFAGTLAAASGTFGTITAGALQGTLTVGGRLATTIGASIDVNGYFISQLVNTKINTNAQTILKDFNFGAVDYAGAVKSGTITWNTTTGAITGGSGVVVYRGGIVGANAGVATFTINATDGSAYFKGDIGSGSSITAPNITGGSITGGTITGATIQTAAPNNQAMVLNSNNLTGYMAGGHDISHKRMQLDYDSFELYDSSAIRTTTIDSGGTTFWSTGQAMLANIVFSQSTEMMNLNFPAGVVKGLQFGARTTSLLYNLGSLTFDNTSSLTVLDLTVQSGSRIQANYFAAGSSGYVNFGTTYGSGGYGLRMSGSVLQYYDSGSGGWKSFNAMSLPSGSNYQMLYYYNGTWYASNNVYIGGTSTMLSLVSSRITASAEFTTTNLHTTGNVYTGAINGDSGIVNASTLQTTGYNLTVSTDRNLYLDSGSYTSYSIYLGYNTRPQDVNINYNRDANFYYQGGVAVVIDNNIWTDGAVYTQNDYNFNAGGQLHSTGTRIDINKEVSVAGSIYSTGNYYTGGTSGRAHNSFWSATLQAYVLCDRAPL